jgi:hypothetical protein
VGKRGRWVGSQFTRYGISASDLCRLEVGIRICTRGVEKPNAAGRDVASCRPENALGSDLVYCLGFRVQGSGFRV